MYSHHICPVFCREWRWLVFEGSKGEYTSSLIVKYHESDHMWCAKKTHLEIRVCLETGRVEIAWQNGGVAWTVALQCVCTSDDITSLNNYVLLKHKV